MDAAQGERLSTPRRLSSPVTLRYVGPRANATEPEPSAQVEEDSSVPLWVEEACESALGTVTWTVYY